MADYALFLKFDFNNKGTLQSNTRQTRHPDRRFWGEVQLVGGVLSLLAGNSNNADTTSMQMKAQTAGTDRVYFAVLFTNPQPQLNQVSYMCAINPVVVGNNATVASPFRQPNGQVRLFYSDNGFTNIKVGGDTFQAIGPYDLNKDPGAQVGDCCFYKLTLVVNATRQGTTQDFSYDPDMDVEMGL